MRTPVALPPAKEELPIKRIGEPLSREAQNLRKQAEGMPPGIQRDDLLKKARQVDMARQIDERVSSPARMSK
jgi:hypothetical protein